MLEKDFNTIITKSLNNQGGFGFKIPDTFTSSSSFTRSKAPYDLFGYFNNHFIAWESKYLQKSESFQLTRLEDHQIENLIKAYEMCENSIAVFAIGINFGRADTRVFIWKNEDLYKIRDRKINKQNIFKKEFEQRTNYIKLSKGELDIHKVLELPLDSYNITN